MSGYNSGLKKVQLFKEGDKAGRATIMKVYGTQEHSFARDVFYEVLYHCCGGTAKIPHQAALTRQRRQSQFCAECSRSRKAQRAKQGKDNEDSEGAFSGVIARWSVTTPCPGGGVHHWPFFPSAMGRWFGQRDVKPHMNDSD